MYKIKNNKAVAILHRYVATVNHNPLGSRIREHTKPYKLQQIHVLVYVLVQEGHCTKPDKLQQNDTVGV